MKIENNLSKRCPLKTPPFERVFEDFYFTKHNIGSSPKPPSAQDNSFDNQIVRGKLLPELIIYENKQWHFIENISLDWVTGHLHNPDPVRKENFKGYPAHFHTDLSILDEQFHIDFYGIGYWGLGSSLKEIRVYKNDTLINRGGNGNAYIASFKQNLPLVIPFENSILLFHKADYDSEKIALDIPISLWQYFPTLLEK